MATGGGLKPHLARLAEDRLRRQVKTELRKRMRTVRGALPAAAAAERSARIRQAVLSLPPLAGARAVGLFWPMEQRREVDLREVDARLRERGVRVAYPAIPPREEAPDAPRDAQVSERFARDPQVSQRFARDPQVSERFALDRPAPLLFRFVSDPRSMQARADGYGMGLIEPTADEPLASPGALDVIVVPALAVDPTGQRIGYGGGHYDATLPLYAPPATTIAVAYDFQLMAEIPATDGDVAVQWVITDARTLAATPAPPR